MPHTYRLAAARQGSDLNLMFGPIDPDRLAGLLTFVLIAAGYMFMLLCVAGWIRYASVHRDPANRVSALSCVFLHTVALAVATGAAMLTWGLYRPDEDVSIFLKALVVATMTGSAVLGLGAFDALMRRLRRQPSAIPSVKE